MKIKGHLLCWHLLQSHTPPPLLHHSCHNCKNSTNTHARSRIFTLTHTQHFSCSHLFPLTMALSSWCLCAHSLLQLACNVCVCVCVCLCVCVWVCHCLLLPRFQITAQTCSAHLCPCSTREKVDSEPCFHPQRND